MAHADPLINWQTCSLTGSPWMTVIVAIAGREQLMKGSEVSRGVSAQIKKLLHESDCNLWPGQHRLRWVKHEAAHAFRLGLHFYNRVHVKQIKSALKSCKFVTNSVSSKTKIAHLLQWLKNKMQQHNLQYEPLSRLCNRPQTSLRLGKRHQIN